MHGNINDYLRIFFAVYDTTNVMSIQNKILTNQKQIHLQHCNCNNAIITPESSIFLAAQKWKYDTAKQNFR